MFFSKVSANDLTKAITLVNHMQRISVCEYSTAK